MNKAKNDRESLKNWFEDDEDEYIKHLNQGMRKYGESSDSDELSGLEDYEE